MRLLFAETARDFKSSSTELSSTGGASSTACCWSVRKGFLRLEVLIDERRVSSCFLGDVSAGSQPSEPFGCSM